MTDFPYFRASIILHVVDELYSEPVDFEIVADDCFTISRDETHECNKNPDNFPGIPGFSIDFSISDAIRLRNFLNYALPLDLEE